MVSKIQEIINNLHHENHLQLMFKDIDVYSYEREQQSPNFSNYYSNYRVLISVLLDQVRLTVLLDNFVYVDYSANKANMEFNDNEITIKNTITPKLPYTTCTVKISNKHIRFEQQYRNKPVTVQTLLHFESIILTLFDCTSMKIINAEVDSYIDYNVKPKTPPQQKACYIATLAYEDINHPKVEYLRNYRDNSLSKTLLGKEFIKFYYRRSPSLVSKLKPFKKLHLFIKYCLNTFIYIHSQINKNLKL